MGAYLESEGLELREMVNGVRTWKDICVVDYYQGPTLPCPWLAVDMVGHVAWLAGTTPGPVVGPPPDPAPVKIMPRVLGAVPPSGPAPSAAPAPHVVRLVSDAVSNAWAISILYAILPVVGLVAVLSTEWTHWREVQDGWTSAPPYTPHWAAVFLLVPIGFAVHRIWLTSSLGPDAIFLHYRPIGLELQEGRVIGSIALIGASIFAARMEETSFWLPWLLMPIAAYLLVGWDSTILERGRYRAGPLYRPEPIGRLELGLGIVPGRGVRLTLFTGAYPARQLTQITSEREAVDLLEHFCATYQIAPALERRR